MRVSWICGSDIRAIYWEHLGGGLEAYRGVIAGHEPCGRVVAVGAEETTRMPDELSYVDGALKTHLYPLAHGATAVMRSLTRRPARVV